MIEKELAVNEGQMLAVRLAPEMVDVVHTIAAAEQKRIRQVMEELIRFGLQNMPKKRRIRPKEDDQSTRRKLFAEFRKAQQRGEVIPWTTKKMLAVRLPPELVAEVRSYAVAEHKNIAVVLEEFIRLKLAQPENLDQHGAILAQTPPSPFRKRQERQNNHTVAYDQYSEEAL